MVRAVNALPLLTNSGSHGAKVETRILREALYRKVNEQSRETEVKSERARVSGRRDARVNVRASCYQRRSDAVASLAKDLGNASAG